MGDDNKEMLFDMGRFKSRAHNDNNQWANRRKKLHSQFYQHRPKYYLLEREAKKSVRQKGCTKPCEANLKFHLKQKNTKFG